MSLRTVGKKQDKPNFKPNVHWQLVGLKQILVYIKAYN